MEDERKRGPTRHIPPVLFAAVFLAGAWLELGVQRLRLLDALPQRARVIAGVGIVILGLGLALWSVVVFVRAHTTFLPFRAASTLVQHGPYRYSRNPIYVGDAITYVGAAIALDAGWPLLLLPVAIALVRWLVIPKEEAHLRERFGGEYDAYRARVRRWL